MYSNQTMTFANVPLLLINSEEDFTLNYTASYPESTSQTFRIEPFLFPEKLVSSYKDALKVANNTNSTDTEGPVEDNTDLMTFLISILVLLAVIAGAGVGIHRLHKKYQFINGKIIKREVPLKPNGLSGESLR